MDKIEYVNSEFMTMKKVTKKKKKETPLPFPRTYITIHKNRMQMEDVDSHDWIRSDRT